MARKVREQGIVVLQVYNIDLTAASADAAMDMMCPGDGAQVLDWTLQVSTAGTGAGTHTCTLEHGTTTAGVAIGADIAFIATDAAGTIESTGADGVYLSTTVYGTKIQIKNVESGTDITTGAKVDVMVRWLL